MYCLKFNGESDLVSVMQNYEDLFGTELNEKILVSRMINQRFLKEERKMPKGPIFL